MRRAPNALAVARAAAVVPVIWLLGHDELAWWALAVFSVAALTDAIDGPIARRTGGATPLGAFLDPLADKILILGTLVALLAHEAVEPWPVLVILGREALAVALRSAGAFRGIAIEASAYGKAKTLTQAVAVAALLLAVAVPGELIATFAAMALAAAVALTVASGADLAIRAPMLLFAERQRAAVNAR